MQIFLNWRRRTTVGLSSDYQLYSLVGFTCYSIFNVCFYFVGSIQDEYEDRNDGNENKVEIQDVLFALHALFATIVTLSQIAYYDGKKQLPSLLCTRIVSLAMLLAVLYATLVACHVNNSEEPFQWLDFVLFLSYIKLALTLLKYIPQAVLNYSRQSTVGWNILNVLLDFTGGVLSLLQLILDCWDTHDWGGISGDPVKFGLAAISIAFDITFMVQHYVLYAEAKGYVEA
jgi:cystinosin